MGPTRPARRCPEPERGLSRRGTGRPGGRTSLGILARPILATCGPGSQHGGDGLWILPAAAAWEVQKFLIDLFEVKKSEAWG